MHAGADLDRWTDDAGAALRRCGSALLRALDAIKVIIGMWVAALVATPSAARAWDDRLDETVAYRQQLKAYDNSKQYGAERVSDRVRTAFRADGIRAGDFIIYPSVGFATVLDDNVYASPGPRLSDLRFELTPQVQMRSQLPRHALDLSLGGRIVSFAEHDDLNHNDAFAKAAGALHFDHAHTLAASLLSELVHPDVLDVSSPVGARRPVELWHNRASVGLTRDAGRIFGTVSAGIETWDYHPIRLSSGAIVDQDARDARLFDTQIRVGYRISPGFELLARLRGLRYVATHESGEENTATGYEAFAGLAFQSSPLLRWRLLGGYGVRDYDQPGRAPLATSLLEGEVEWLASQRLTITATARRSIAESSGTLASEGVGRIENALLVKAQYEVWRNLVVSLGGEIRDQEFVGVERHDRVALARIGLEYLWTRNVNLSLSWEHQYRDSSLNEFDLRRNLFTVGARVQF